MSSALRLPTIRAVAKLANVELTATPSLNIDHPPGTQSIQNANDLLSAVTDSHLWINRAGACCIEVSLSIDDVPILEHDHLESVITAITNSEVFQHSLGNRPLLI